MQKQLIQKKKKIIGRMGIRTSNVQKLRFLVRMSFAIEWRENEDIRYTENALHPLKKESESDMNKQ